MKNQKSHELRSKCVLNKNNKNTNPDLRTQTQKKKKQPFNTKFSSKSLIHMNPVNKPISNKPINLYFLRKKKKNPKNLSQIQIHKSQSPHFLKPKKIIKDS